MTNVELRTWLCEQISKLAPVAPSEISTKEPLSSYGLGSVDAVRLAGELSARLGRKISPTLAYEYPTLGELIDYLEGRANTREAQRAPAVSVQAVNEPIAIVGMGVRLPGADDPEAFWKLLAEGRDLIGRIPDDRFSRWGRQGNARSAIGGFLRGVGGLDLDFFGIGEREAAAMDPQQRLLLEVAWEALEDAGIDPNALTGSQTGVFVGISSSDYRELVSDSPGADAYTLLGNASSVAANRLSYLLDLRGPSISVDTACSSSLVAVHLACEAIRNGECDMAIVAGVNVILTPSITAAFESSGMMAPDGRCKAFSARADGFVRSEGAGVVVLRPASAAQRAGDRISAVIRGTAVTTDGRTNGLLAPSRKAQEAVVRQALARAGVQPQEVSYVEAHGTGTSIGDHIEAAALGGVLGRGRAADQPCAIGSVKTNLGHLEAAAGIVGLLKVALCFEHKALPPSLHCEELNPDIDFAGLGLRVQRALEPWDVGERAVAGVSSFGFGGTNAHAVLGPAAEAERAGVRRHPVHVLALAAASEAGLQAQATRYAAWAETLGAEELARACAAMTSARGRSGARGRNCRAAFAFEEPRELLERLRDTVTAHRPSTDIAGPVFVFPGQGGQWLGMGRAWLGLESAFDLAIDRCERAFAPYVSWSLKEVLTSEDAASLFERIDVVQPAIFAMQVGLAAVFQAWSVRPAGVIGHSMGEAAAAYVSGALRLDDAARVICRRSALMASHRGEGAMALVSLPVERVRELLAPYGLRLSLAAHNGPSTTVVSGQAEAVTDFVAAMEKQEVFCRRVKVDVASHCALLEDLQPGIVSALEGLAPRASKIPFYSSLVGERLETDSLSATYWWRNLREPVLFADAVGAARSAGHQTFLELSPHPLLSVSVEDCFAAASEPVVAVPAMRRTDRRAPYDAIAALHEAGCTIDWKKFYGGRPSAPATRLPTYAWQHQEYWLELSELPHSEGMLISGSLPAIRDHRVQGRAIAPAAWMLDVALEALNRDGVHRHGLADVLVINPLAVAEGESRYVRVSRRARGASAPILSVESRPADRHDAPWEEHVSAAWSSAPQDPESSDPSGIRERCAKHVEPSALYEHLAASDLVYGETMRTVRDIWLGDGEVLAELAPPSAMTEGHWLPADVVDGAMQSIAALSIETGGRGTFVGFGYRRATSFAKWSGPSFVHTQLRGALEHEADSFDCDVRILSPEGKVLVHFEQVSLKRLRNQHAMRFFAVETRQQSLPSSSGNAPSRVVVLSSDDRACAALLRELEGAGASCEIAAMPSGEESSNLFDAYAEESRFVCVEPARDAFFALVRAAASSQASAQRELAVVTSDATLPPLLSALEQEATGWRGRVIRIEAEDLASKETALNVVSELRYPPSAFVVRYQRGERAVPTLVPVEEPLEPKALRPRGVYWLTGGQGGLGSTLALTLAREVGARVMITGRRPDIDPELQSEIAEAGGELLYVQADVTDAQATRRAKAAVLSRFGALHGVIHTAGLLQDSLLESTSLQQLKTIMAPKEDGARLLIDAVSSEDLDFIVLFSSLASLFVTPGQGCYGAANAALDELAGGGRGRRTPVRSLNWGPWSELGMVADEKYQQHFLDAGIHPITPEDGAQAFLQALSSPFEQMALVDVRDDVAEGLIGRFNRGQGAPAPARARGARQDGGGGSPVEFVRAELARALRRSPSEIDTTVRFDRLGVDSLLAVAVTRRIGAHYGVELPATFMFKHRTVEAVASYLDSLIADDPIQTEARGVEARCEAIEPSAQEVILDEALRHSVVPGYTVVSTTAGLEMRLQHVPVRKPAPDEIVIDVRAIGVNFIDVLASTGFHPFLSTPPFVPGHEVAGVVHAIGERVEHVKVGDSVIALANQGGYAARVTTPAFTVRTLPSGVSPVDAVSMLISGLTAIACLERAAKVNRGDRVLIQAAAGATGTACVQLALHHGATVFGTASKPEKLAHLTALGVQHPINYAEVDFADAVKAISPDRGLDLIVDSLSGDAVTRGLPLLRAGGQFIEIGAAGVLDLAVNGRDLFMSSRSFCTVNVSALARDPLVLEPMMARLTELVAMGVFRPAIGGVFRFGDAPEAIAQLRKRANIGKFVVVHE